MATSSGSEAEAEARKAEAEARKAEAESQNLKYKADAAQRSNMVSVLLITVAAATIVMILSIFVPYYFVYRAEYASTNSSATKGILGTSTNASLIEDAPKNVLPFATGLVGFAGGVVTSLFERTVHTRNRDIV